MGEHQDSVTDDTFAPTCCRATGRCSSTSGRSGAGRAAWSPRCSRRSPAEHADKLRVVKLNIDENPEIARDYQIMSIPTMSVFVGGQVVKSIVGAKPKAAILNDLAAYL